MNSFLGGVVAGLRQRSVVIAVVGSGSGRPLLQRRFAHRLYHASSKRTTTTATTKTAKVSCPSTDAPQRSAAATSHAADSAVSSAGSAAAAPAAMPRIDSTIPHLGKGIAVGQYGTMERSFDKEEVDRFSRLIHDFNPLHKEGDRTDYDCRDGTGIGIGTGIGTGTDRNNASSGKDNGEGHYSLEVSLDPQTTAALRAAGLIRYCNEDDDADRSADRNGNADRNADGNGNGNGRVPTPPPKRSRRKAVVHGVLVSSLFSSIFAHLAPGCVYRSQTLDYSSPVWAGDALVGSVRVVAARNLGRGGGRGSGSGVLVRCDTTVFVVGEDGDDTAGGAESARPLPARLVVKGQATVWLPIGWTARSAR